jgi:uncharacterized protein
MNSDFMPLKLDAFKEASAKRKITFSVPVSSFPRVLETLLDPSSELRGVILFGIDDDKKSYVDLSLKGSLELNCQRCLGVVPFEVSLTRRLRPVFADQLDSDLVGEVEPVLMDENGLIDVVEMLEDELLLALPMSPMHSVELCEATFPEAEVFVEKQETKRPFAGLAELLNKK